MNDINHKNGEKPTGETGANPPVNINEANDSAALANKGNGPNGSGTGNIGPDGHRARLRELFMKDMGKTMPDYILLELLLTYALPRMDVKPIAKQLIDNFGSFEGVISAEEYQLSKFNSIKGSAVTLIKLVDAAALRLLKQRALKQRHVVRAWDALMDYLYASLARLKVEELRIIFLDRKYTIIENEMIQQGTIDATQFYPREIVKRAIELGAFAVVVVHNHPSGDPHPSAEDIAATKQLKIALNALEMELHDHVIISHTTYYSFKSAMLL